MLTSRIAISAALALMIFLHVSLAQSQISCTPGELQHYSNIHSIGVEWNISGDSDHDAKATVNYRQQGAADWKQAMPLLRVDFTNDNSESFNMLAGSILFLTPATTYEVKLDLSDPDGGSASQTITTTTREVPAAPKNGRTLYVVPGSTGGSGTQSDPYKGIAAAQANAQPGDTFILSAGNYDQGSRILFDKSGSAGSYIVWKAADNAQVLLTDGLRIQGSHIWIEGFTVQDAENGLLTYDEPQDIVITRCRFLNNHYGIWLNHGGKGWYITDNIIIGDTPVDSDSFSGEGIELEHSSDHTVAYNRISGAADGISYPGTNVDIFANDIFDTSDDGIELDYGYANNRAWSNRIHNAVHNGISFQPMNGAPWYIIRNQVVSNREGPLKFRTTDRFVLLHNIFVKHNGMIGTNPDHLLRGIVMNNIWIALSAGRIWRFDTAKDWRTTLDYDAIDWADSDWPFRYLGSDYHDISGFAAGSGLEQHAVQISRSTCFPSLNVPGEPPLSVPAQTLTLSQSCGAINAGAVIPNINDGFVGSAPDIGPYESGLPVPAFGPRSSDTVAPAAPSSLRAVN